MKTLARDISLQARNKFPAFYEALRKSDAVNLTTFRLRLFGIPLLKVKKNKVYLFEFIPVFKLLWR